MSTDTDTALDHKTAALGKLPWQVRQILDTKDLTPVKNFNVSQTRVDAYISSVGDTNVIHTDPYVAIHRYNLEGTVAPGIQMVGFVTAIFVDLLGADGTDRMGQVLGLDEVRFRGNVVLIDGFSAMLTLHARCTTWRLARGQITARIGFQVRPVTDTLPRAEALLEGLMLLAIKV